MTSPDIESETFTFSSSIPDGTYWIGAVADQNDQISEVDETNNVGTPLQITIASSDLPDLEITDFQVDRTHVLQGDSIDISWNVSNSGLQASGPDLMAGVYLSTNQTFTTSDLLLTDVAFGDVAGGTTLGPYSIDDLELPDTLAPSTYWIGVVADPTDAANESDEANNLSNLHAVTIYPEGSAILPDGFAQVSIDGTYSHATSDGNVLAVSVSSA